MDAPPQPKRRGRPPRSQQDGDVLAPKPRRAAAPREPKDNTAAAAANSPPSPAERDTFTEGPADEHEKSFRRAFEQPLMMVMHAHGDDRHPLQETVTLLEDIVIEYSTKMLYAALDRAVLREKSTRGSKTLPKLEGDDFLSLVEGDPLKYARVKELITNAAAFNVAKAAIENPLEDVEGLVEQFADK